MLSVLVLLATSSAQVVTGGDLPKLNSQLWRPTIDTRSTLWTDDTLRARSGTGTASALLSYVHRPFIYTSGGDSRILVSDALQLDLLAGLTLGRFRVGANLPVYLFAAGESTSGTGLGDIAVDGKVYLTDRVKDPVGLALSSRLTLPVATVDLPLGTGKLGWELQGTVDKELGRVLLAGNVGTRVMPTVELENVTLGDQLFWRAAGAYSIGERSGLSLDFGGQVNYSAPLENGAAMPVETILGGWHGLGDSLVLRGGVGTGLSTGIGSPVVRVIAGLAWHPPSEPRVRPDRVRDSVEPAPVGPAPGILQVEVVGPDGSPVDGAVAYVDGFTPVDVDEAIQLAPGSHVVRVEAKGFRASKQQVDIESVVESTLRFTLAESKVSFDGDTIDLKESIFFDTSKATIKAASFEMLDEVADILDVHPEITLIRVEGHTDSRGSAAFNLDLSERRAASVRQYLIDHGLERDRVESKGYGETKPVDPRELAEAWEKNRRVDLFIVERTD